MVKTEPTYSLHHVTRLPMLKGSDRVSDSCLTLLTGLAPLRIMRSGPIHKSGELEMARNPTPTNSTNPADVIKYGFRVSENKKAQLAKNTSLVEVTFDFNGVSRDAMKLLVIRNMAITLQSRMRGMTTGKNAKRWPEVVKAFNGTTVKVAEALDNTRVRVTPAQRIARVASKQSPADIAAAIKLLEDQLKSASKS